MKQLLFLVIVSISFSVLAQEKIQLDWQTDLEEATKISKETNRPILIYFTGSDWCPPCKKLKKDFFYTKKFKERSKNFVLVMADFPKNRSLISQQQLSKNIELLRKYNPQNKFPNIVIVNDKGEKIDNMMSYNRNRGTSRHYKFLEKVLKKYN